MRLNKLTNIKRVVLSGGVMQNRIILNNLMHELGKRNFQVYVPSLLPMNDSCISAGQVVIANVSGSTG